jgi:triphosphoribosyl-dephospho-CoA synthase
MSRSSSSNALPVSIAATLAVICEVSAPKPGNVHRGADFEDLTYVDFLHSAVIVGPILERAAESGVGRIVLDAVQATRDRVGTNTNLGTLLLIAPLACVPENVPHEDGIASVLSRLTTDDTRQVYEAIRISAAGGLGRVADADVFNEPPPIPLVDVMRLAGERDLIARQYCHNFADVVRLAMWIEEGRAGGWPLDDAIVHTQIRQLALEADSLIRRKCGQQVAEQSRVMAERLLESGSPGDDVYHRALADFDFWLRADGHRRNPGTTADLLAAALFVLLREGRLELKS